MTNNITRRNALRRTSGVLAGLGAISLFPNNLFAEEERKNLWKISLCEYSLHRMIAAKKLDPLDFGPYTKREFGIAGADYWNHPFADKVNDDSYLAEMKKRSDDAGVAGGVILIDGEGHLGDPDENRRVKSVKNHHKWIDAAKKMGCYAIRVNAHSSGSFEEQMKLAADGLSRLCEYGAQNRISVIVENHGGCSSNGKWLSGVMKLVNNPICGTLPDFGNFKEYDRYQGTKELMPYAKNVSAKSRVFDKNGNERQTDYYRIMKIVSDSGFRGWVGIEYEGGGYSEVEGIKLTLALLNRVHARLLKEQSHTL